MVDVPPEPWTGGRTHHPPCLPSPIPVVTPMQMIIYSIKIRHVPKDPGSTIHRILILPMFIYPSNSRDLGFCYGGGRLGSCGSWVIGRKIADRSCGSWVMRRKTTLDTRILEFAQASCHGIQGSWISFNDRLMDLADLLTLPGFSRWNRNDGTYRCKMCSTLSYINLTPSNKISETFVKKLLRNCFLVTHLWTYVTTYF